MTSMKAIRFVYALAAALDAAYDIGESVSEHTLCQSIRVAVAQLEADLQPEPFAIAIQPRCRPSLQSVGHGHLDVAWLWQTGHTREKAARTFAIATASDGRIS